MRKIYLIKLILLFFAFHSSFAQIDTSGGRYWNEIFPSVTVTSDISYGSNIKYNGQTQVLKLDVYEPQGDVILLRPLLILAHGGSFLGGTKTDGDVTSLCTHFAKMGYVTVSMEYRVGMSAIDSVNAIKAVLRATQDMKAAVRFFRQNAANGNTYRIHPDYIFTGGSSAGAFTALHAAYLDKVAEFPLGATVLNAMGGIDGTSGNPGFSSSSLAVVNLCGALGDSSWMEPGDIPFVSMHGTNDGIVPYATAIIQIVIFQIMWVDGSASLHLRANNIGIQNPFYTFNGANHVPYAGNTATALAYMDTTVQFVKEFLRPFLGIPSPTNITENNNTHEIKISPNPSNGSFTIGIKNLDQLVEAHLFDLTGRIIDKFIINDQKNYYSNLNLEKGVYFLKIINRNKIISSQKVIIN